MDLKGLSKLQQEIDDAGMGDPLKREIKELRSNIEQMCNDLWALLYPDDPTGWEYRTQPLVHIRVELEQLRVENAKLWGVVKEFINQAEITDTNCTYCIICSGWDQDYEGVLHKDSCVVKKARALK